MSETLVLSVAGSIIVAMGAIIWWGIKSFISNSGKVQESIASAISSNHTKNSEVLNVMAKLETAVAGQGQRLIELAMDVKEIRQNYQSLNDKILEIEKNMLLEYMRRQDFDREMDKHEKTHDILLKRIEELERSK